MVFPSAVLSPLVQELLEFKAHLLIPDILQKQLITLQTIQRMIMGLLYHQRKYNRQCPDLGFAIWYGRAMKQLDITETQIDRIQAEMKQYLSIQDN